MPRPPGSKLRAVRRWRVLLFLSEPIAFLALVYVVLKAAPDWFAQTAGLDERAIALERQGIRTASLALLAGAFAVISAVYTARTYTLNRAGQLTDRFTKAIEQLGNTDALDVRLGGIYALERIARDSKEDHPQVIEVLTAYVREHAPRPADGPDEAADQTPAAARLSTDVQAALTVLGRRVVAHEQDAQPDLDLGAAQLTNARLAGATLSWANLSGADLRGAGLRRADLTWADLSAADLRGANLRGADLRWARLSGADLREADLSGASLSGARLSRADLSGTDLRGADLSGAGLSEANLDGSRYDQNTTWPAGLNPASRAARLQDSTGE